MAKKIGVFLGANVGKNDAFINVAISLGEAIAQRGLCLVYGGASVGLMGYLANAALSFNGEVIGVFSNDLPNESAHHGLSHLHRVNTLTERKAMLMNLSDGFLTMPGGLGTWEELTQIWNALKIGSIDKKFCGLINTCGYYNPLIKMIEQACDYGFLQSQHANMVKVSSDIDHLLEQFEACCSV